MTSFNLYLTVPLAPLEPQSYHLNVILGKKQGLKRLEESIRRNTKSTLNILERLTWLNACSSSLSIATGISSVITFSTVIGLPVSIPLGVASLTGVIASGIISALTKKYQRKLSKVMKLVDIVTSAIAVFETSLSKALSNGKIDEEEFNSLHTLYFKALNELTSTDCKMEAENRNQFEKSLLEEINDIKKTLGTKV